MSIFCLDTELGKGTWNYVFFIFFVNIFVAFFRHIDRYKDKAVDELGQTSNY